MQFDEKMPIYIQIVDEIKNDIITGKLKGGDKLASVREMAENFKVNPNTIQRVYQELERQKITFSQRGMGTYIVDDGEILNDIKMERANELITKFIEGMQSIGYDRNGIIKSIKEHLEGGKGNE